jgi:hypothetical protein
MQIELTKDEQQLLLACIDSAVKHAPNSLQAAVQIMPLVQKIAEAKQDEPTAE